MWEGGRDGEGTRVDCSSVFLSSVLDTKDYLFSTCGGFQVIIALCRCCLCVCVESGYCIVSLVLSLIFDGDGDGMEADLFISCDVWLLWGIIFS